LGTGRWGFEASGTQSSAARRAPPRPCPKSAAPRTAWG
jgi:hypothetical protein